MSTAFYSALIILRSVPLLHTVFGGGRGEENLELFYMKAVCGQNAETMNSSDSCYIQCLLKVKGLIAFGKISNV
jgi:hypothetical protein